MTCQHQVEAMDSFHHLKLREEVYFIPDLWTGDNLLRPFRCPALPFENYLNDEGDECLGEKRLFRYVNGDALWKVKIPKTLDACRTNRFQESSAVEWWIYEDGLFVGLNTGCWGIEHRNDAKGSPFVEQHHRIPTGIDATDALTFALIDRLSDSPLPCTIPPVGDPLPDGRASRKWIKGKRQKARRWLLPEEKDWKLAHPLPNPRQKEVGIRNWEERTADELNQGICLIVAEKYSGIGLTLAQRYPWLSVENLWKKSSQRAIQRFESRRNAAKDYCELLTNIARPYGQIGAYSYDRLAAMTNQPLVAIRRACAALERVFGDFDGNLRLLYNRESERLSQDVQWLIQMGWTNLAEAAALEGEFEADIAHTLQKIKDGPPQYADEAPLETKEMRD